MSHRRSLAAAVTVRHPVGSGSRRRRHARATLTAIAGRGVVMPLLAAVVFTVPLLLVALVSQLLVWTQL